MANDHAKDDSMRSLLPHTAATRTAEEWIARVAREINIRPAMWSAVAFKGAHAVFETFKGASPGLALFEM